MNAKEKINEISKLCLAGEGWGGCSGFVWRWFCAEYLSIYNFLPYCDNVM